MIDTRQILARTDLLALVGETVALRKSGAEHYGRCPLHADKSPTLRVNGTKGLWHCPSCQVGGDAIAWVEHVQGLDFKAAAAELARRAGIDPATSSDTAPIAAPRKPKFPRPDPRPITPWGGQHLMAADGRSVYVLNDFPGRRRYLALAEQYPGIDLIWWPKPYSRAQDMYLEPIALCRIIAEPFPGLWEAYRAAALLDAIAGWRKHSRASVAPAVHDHLMIEAMRVEGWIEWHLERRLPSGLTDTLSLDPSVSSRQQLAGRGGDTDAGAPSSNETGHAAAA